MHCKFATLAAIGFAINTVGATTFSYTPSAVKRSDSLGHATNTVARGNGVLKGQTRRGSTERRQPDALESLSSPSPPQKAAAALDNRILREQIKAAIAKRQGDAMRSMDDIPVPSVLEDEMLQEAVAGGSTNNDKRQPDVVSSLNTASEEEVSQDMKREGSMEKRAIHFSA